MRSIPLSDSDGLVRQSTIFEKLRLCRYILGTGPPLGVKLISWHRLVVS
jgi:hypothetical protein